MPETNLSVDAEEKALRSRRLVQISSLTILGLAVLAARALLAARWAEAAIMGAGITMMLLCQSMNRRGATEPANLMLIMTLTAMVSMLMWRGEGLRDSALLAFPAVLISAGLLIRPTHVPRLLAAMFLVVAGLLAGTLLGYRTDRAPDALTTTTTSTIVRKRRF
jgi:hypothetical protein